MFGGVALAQLIEPVSGPLRLVSGAVLVALAVRGAVPAIGEWRAHRAATGPAVRTGGRVCTPVRAYFALLAVTMVNPATVVYFAALVVGGHARIAASAADAAVFVAAAFAASASWQSVLVGGGALLGRVLTGARGRLITALASSVVIAGLAVLVVSG